MDPITTTKEALLFNFSLKSVKPSRISKENWKKIPESVLKQLGLSQVKDSKVGNALVRGISGGQRRRVTLGKGLMSGAFIMFCDEPTSGLSATDAEKCIKALKNTVTLTNKTIVVVIHQPRIEVCELFDELILMAANPGRIVYNGKMADAID